MTGNRFLRRVKFCFLSAAIGGGLVGLFWSLLGSRLSVSPWMVAILPAALWGMALGFAEPGGWRKWVGMFLVLGAIASAGMGEWSRVDHGVRQALARPKSSEELKGEALRAIARMEMGEENTDGTVTEMGSRVDEKVIMKGWWAMPTLWMTGERVWREPGGFLLSVIVSLFGAWQGRRIFKREDP